MKKKITIEEYRNIIKSYKGSSMALHIAKELFDENHPLASVCSFDLKNHLFDYIEIINDTNRSNTDDLENKEVRS